MQGVLKLHTSVREVLLDLCPSLASNILGVSSPARRLAGPQGKLGAVGYAEKSSTHGFVDLS